MIAIQVIFLTVLATFASATSVVSPIPSASFVSSKVQTGYISKCTTFSFSTSTSSVPTSVTFSTNFQDRTIKTTATFTPTSNVFTTVPYTTTSTPTSYIYTTTAAPVKRDSDHLMAKRATSYPNNVDCAVTGMPVTTYFYTSTAASRTVTRINSATTVYQTAPTNSIISQAPVNGGFEQQGDWAVESGDGSNAMIISNDSGNAHSGQGYYRLGLGGSPEAVIQADKILGNPGDLYTLTFWLSLDCTTPGSYFNALWNGQTVFDSSQVPGAPFNAPSNFFYGIKSVPWTAYTAQVTAAATNVLQFKGYADCTYFKLDDVTLQNKK